MKLSCFECGHPITALGVSDLGDAMLAHARSEHDWPYPDQNIRQSTINRAEATERLTGATERLSAISDPVIHPVTGDRFDDWIRFFDHDAFAGNPEWADCYCLEPHTKAAGGEEEDRLAPWQETRARMMDLLSSGGAFGYLAYVDDRPAGWVNASMRSHYGSYYQPGDGEAPADTDVVGVSCFIIAPPYRRHGLAGNLLDRVIRDAPERGAGWVEGYPLNDPESSDAHNYRGPRSMYHERGFEPAEVRSADTIVRLRVGSVES